MNWSLFWKSALVQLLAVAALFILLAILLPKSFFKDWGWVTGPIAWMLCAGVTAAVLRLPKGPVLLGAVLAGLPSVLAVVTGVHAAGPLIGAAFFGLWCGYRFRAEPASR